MPRILNIVSGSLFGCALALMATGSLAGAAAKDQRVMYKFAGGSDGEYPVASLVRDKAGNLYGTTIEGGDAPCHSGASCGTVFKIAPDGTETLLYSFQGGADGARPTWLIRDKAGNMFGTTAQGGGAGCFNSDGCGTVFRLAPDGTETVLHAFSGGEDGGYPGSLIVGRKGNLFGIAQAGGSQYCNNYGCGLVFKLTPDGREKVLYSFTGKADGGHPSPGLVLDNDGNLYGATSGGGAADCSCGTVFKLDRKGNESVLHAFSGGADGAFPGAGPIGDAAGNLYGTTQAEGDENCGYGGGCGTVFKLAPDGAETILYTFSDLNISGPMAPLLRDESGNLYGTTAGFGAGAVFKLMPDGTLSALHVFDGSDGAYPFGGVIADRKGHLYGTTEEGGSGCFDGTGCGVVFKLRE